ncbi:tetrahydroberberine oxidase-like [Curcuma longa]|uniref:tetrahydroberberine oxidase-like n=1 Tax=Curcuma longa TaxID=136217 RepID=UPI003D9EA43D
MASAVIFSWFLFFLLCTSHAANHQHANFLRCFLEETGGSSSSPSIIYTPNATSFATLYRSSIQNLRFLSSGAETPSFLIVPSVAHDAQTAVLCGRRHGVRLRVRSGGHDYEGLSYVSFSRTDGPFAVLDLSGLRSIDVDAEARTAWVGAGATVGEVYYHVAAASPTAAFPAGVCTTVGVGGQFSGGGVGSLQRKYGVSADNIVDAELVNAKGELLTRETMGEDLFWAIRGGGAANFGVVVAYKLRLVPVPPRLTLFSVSRTLEEGATRLLHSWQSIAPRVADDLWLRTMAQAVGEAPVNRTIQVIFQGLFLGPRHGMLAAINKSFPELGVRAEDCNELSWVETTLSLDGHALNDPSVLLDRRRVYNSSFKGKSDFVRKPISQKAWEGIWEVMMEGEEEPLFMVIEPWGGRLWDIEDDAIAFPHRKGNLYNIQYFMRWFDQTQVAAVTERHLTWMRRLYDYMAPHVSSNPRAAYLNYKDIDLGSSTEEGRTSYMEASAWGRRYFLHNFDKLAIVKARVDPENYFWNEQGIPPFAAW